MQITSFSGQTWEKELFSGVTWWRLSGVGLGFPQLKT
jgi:hypothetical protein